MPSSFAGGWLPELVENGPDIPVELMNQLDDGRVVFFCGAGISMGTGLPSFGGLVEHVYKSTHVIPDDLEREALDSDAPEDRRRPKYDKALGLLERAERLGTVAPPYSSRMRHIIIDRLSQPATHKLSVHRALIELSKTPSGIRLVTTNFDSRFKSAGRSLGLSESHIDSAPKLPVPKPHSWHSLVHLHGRIQKGGGGSDLVLTAADFGRAYLTERWASRFVTELFREFTVVFVGYSLDDPVMGYLVDALAAERSRGIRFNEAFAFAQHDETSGDIERKRRGWEAKNVRPILYANRNGHRLLNDTLIQWARIRDDPFAARTQIALNEISKLPDASSIPRVTWALGDAVASSALAGAPPIEIEQDFPKVGAWLKAFDEAGLLSRAQVLKGTEGNPTVPAVDHGFNALNPAPLDDVSRFLCIWLSKHLHVPQVLEWVAQKGGYLHPDLRDLVRRQLASDTSIHPRLRMLWTVASSQSYKDTSADLWLDAQFTCAKSDLERQALTRMAMEQISPRLELRPGPSSHLKFKQIYEGEKTSLSPVLSCAHLDLVVGSRDSTYAIEKLFEKPKILAAHAHDLTSHLEEAVYLLAEADDRERNSAWYRPSIAPHSQNKHRDKWTVLIDWVRDSYLQLAISDPKQADGLLQRWQASGIPLFKRLVLHSITENPKSDIRMIDSLLLKGRKPGLWETEFRREVLRLFRKAGKRIPRDLRRTLVAKIEAGPR